jgi:hypothetical protein
MNSIQAISNNTKPLNSFKYKVPPPMSEASPGDQLQERLMQLRQDHELFAFTRKRIIKKMAELDITIQQAAVAAADIIYEHPVRTCDDSEKIKALIKEKFSPAEIDLLAWEHLSIKDEEIDRARIKASRKTEFDYLTKQQQDMFRSVKNKVKKYLQINNVHKDIDKLNHLNDVFKAVSMLKYDYIAEKKSDSALKQAQVFVDRVGLTTEEVDFFASSLFPFQKLQNAISPPKPAHWIIN